MRQDCNPESFDILLLSPACCSSQGCSSNQIVESMEEQAIEARQLRGTTALTWDCVAASCSFSRPEKAAMEERQKNGYAVASLVQIDSHTFRASWKKPVTYQSATSWFGACLKKRKKEDYSLVPVQMKRNACSLRVGPLLTGPRAFFQRATLSISRLHPSGNHIYIYTQINDK